MYRKMLSVLLIPALLYALCFPASAGQLGSLEETLASDSAQWSECSLGDAAADAVRSVCGTQISIVNGGDLDYSLIYGEVTEQNLIDAFPLDRTLCVVSVTPAQLAALLEILLSHLTVAADTTLDTNMSAFAGFPQISGFIMQYDVSAPPGSRLENVTLEDGTQLNLEDMQALLTLSGTDALFSGTYGYTLDGAQSTAYTLRSAFAAYLLQTKTLQAPAANRTTVRGLGGEPLISKIPMILVVVAIVIIGIFSYLHQRRNSKFFTFDPY